MKPLLNVSTYGSGHNLIMLHGLFGSHENLRSLGKALAKKYRIHLLDLRNHGYSFHDAEMSYQDMAEDILAFIHTNHLAPVCILGHSLGGKVAMQAGLLSPEDVSSLIIIDIAPVDYKNNRKENRHSNIIQGLKQLSMTTITSRTEASTLLKDYIDDQAVSAFLLKNLKRTAKNTLELCLNIDAIIKNYDAILGTPEGKPYPYPALFLRGEHSDYFIDKYEEKTCALFPKLQIKTIKNCGHWVHAEQPQAVYHAAEDFLAKVYG